MNKRLIVLFVFVLAMLLTACGGGPTDNAKKFIEASADCDYDKAEDVACEEFAESFVDEDECETAEVEDIECEEDGDDVTCDFKMDGDSQTITFTMEDDKVCGFAGLE